MIFYLSSIPGLEVTSEKVLNFVTRKIGHMVEYGILFLLLHRSFESKKPILAFILAAFYAVTDEVHQIFVPLREGKPTDVLFDSLGAMFGWYAALKLNWVGKHER